MSYLIMDHASSSWIYGSGLCSAPSAAGGRSPDQHIGQALLLTTLGFFVREALPPWAAGPSLEELAEGGKRIKKKNEINE